MNQTAAPRSAREMIIGYFRDFGVLRETRAEYWGVQLINFLDSTAYFGMLTIASVFLSEDIGVSDTTAGYTITVFTAATTLMLLFSGMTTDWLGIRRSLYTALSAQMVLRAALVVIGLMPSLPHRGLLAGAVLLLMAPFLAGIQTVFQAAANRYTTRRSRSAGFNLWYLAMNVGGAAAGFSIDIVRRALELPNVHVFTLGVMISVLCLVATRLLIRTEEQLVDPSEPVELQQEDAQVQHGNPFRQWREIFRSSAIWRLLLLIALVVGVRAVYTYLYLLMPKYWLRTIGPDAAIGTLSAINPIGIVIGLALFIPFANRYPVFRMLAWGAMVSSLALFPLAVPWTLYGLGIAEAHYLMALLFMVVLTIGEVVWLPKLYEYTAAIAPKGQEGTYLGLSMVPWFLAKTGVSAMSGHALERWVPETVAIDGVAVPLQQAMVAGQLGYWQRPEAMWLLFGGVALCGCIVAVLLEKWFTKGVR